MGQIKNIKLHIVTDIKTRSRVEMSRLSSAVSSIRGLIKSAPSTSQVSKSKNIFLPDGAFGVTGFHADPSTVLPKAGGETPVIPAYPYGVRPYREDAWPFLEEYKSIAGKSSVQILAFGLAADLFGSNVVGGGTLAILGIQGFAYYTLYRGIQTPLKNYFRKERNEHMSSLYAKKAEKLDSEAKIAEAAAVASFLEDRPEFFDISENQIELQAEVTYRKRLLEVQTEIKKRLDYQVEMQNVQRAIEEKHIAAWVEKEVLRSISEQKDEDTFQACINNLEDMAAAKATA